MMTDQLHHQIEAVNTAGSAVRRGRRAPTLGFCVAGASYVHIIASTSPRLETAIFASDCEAGPLDDHV